MVDLPAHGGTDCEPSKDLSIEGLTHRVKQVIVDDTGTYIDEHFKISVVTNNTTDDHEYHFKEIKYCHVYPQGPGVTLNDLIKISYTFKYIVNVLENLKKK